MSRHTLWSLALGAATVLCACADASSGPEAQVADAEPRPASTPDGDAPRLFEDAFIARDARAERPDTAPSGADSATRTDAAPTETDAGFPADALETDTGASDVAVPDALIDAALPDAGADACVGSVEVCNGVDDDCDGRIDEELPLQWLDLDGDGYGAPQGVPTCMPAPDRVLDGSDCDDEAPEIHPGAGDVPDPTFADTNCDGVDGTRREMIFVDAAANPLDRDGSPEHPFGSIAEGLAAATENADVMGLAIAAARYEEPVTLIDGVSLFGGYDPGHSWARNARLPTVVASSVADRGHIVTLTANAIRTPTVIDLLTVEASGDPGPGGSLYAIYARTAPGLTLRAVTARSGPAPAGLDGVDGVAGVDGQAGQNGGDCGRPPGAGGASTCGADGGAGGAGSGRGGDGAPGQFPGCGGNGGPRGGGGAGGDGSHGCSPVAVGSGPDGAPGDGGALDPQGFFTPMPGGDGAAGPNGSPGGGGGGGGGAAVIDGTGGAGAGGGAGGCGGQAGTGGTGGGGSFALFVVDSTGLQVRDCTLGSGDGGSGGRGGVGGLPGHGANGATGGHGREAFACGGLAGPGWGGDGGRGADGARGGNGGGGGGGPSVAVYCVGTQLPVGGDTFLQPGVGGMGGLAPTNRGVNGPSAATFGCE